MNILMLSQALPYLPSRGGFRLYGANLIRQLSQRHRVDLVSLLVDDDRDHLEWARQYCASVATVETHDTSAVSKVGNFVATTLRGRPMRHYTAVDSLLKAGLDSKRWDVLHVEGTFAAGLVRQELGLPKVLSVHDSWTLRCTEMLKCAQTLRERLYYRLLNYHEPRYERLVYPRYDRVTVVASPDLAELRRVVPNCRVDLIPYGTDTDYFHPVAVDKEPATLVFHSHLGYAPNIEAALEFANDILPLIRRQVPTATFHLVGAQPGPKIMELVSRPGIKISANLPDLRPAVCSGQIYVCAIRHGTGLKSKMLEAMAMRMPIVGYPGAIVGLDGSVAGKHYLVAQDPQGFAAHVVGLLHEPARADQMAKAGRELVEERYSWESRARAYEDLYQQVIKERELRTQSH